jgi:hypothetical protein
VVSVTTDKGNVKVTRGAQNVWAVTPNGKPTSVYESIGRSLLAPASEIVGMPPVEIGGISFPICLMNQFESHFLLADVGGKSATGSVRAQVFDELSGLSGIEEIIKSVSLDRTRSQREIKQRQEEIAALEKELYDAEELDKAEQRLADCRHALDKADSLRSKALELASEADQHKAEQNAAHAATGALSRLPDEAFANDICTKADTRAKTTDALTTIRSEYMDSAIKVGTADKSIANIPDISGILPDTIEAYAEQCENLQTLYNDYALAKRKQMEAIKALRTLPYAEYPKDAEDKIKVFEALRDILLEYGVVSTSVESSVMDETELTTLESEYDTIMKTVKTCPLTGEPIGSSCTAYKPGL